MKNNGDKTPPAAPVTQTPEQKRLTAIEIATEASYRYIVANVAPSGVGCILALIKSGVFAKMVDGIAENPILGPELTFTLVGKIANPAGYTAVAGREVLPFHQYPELMRRHHLLLHNITRALLSK